MRQTTRFTLLVGVLAAAMCWGSTASAKGEFALRFRALLGRMGITKFLPKPVVRPQLTAAPKRVEPRLELGRLGIQRIQPKNARPYLRRGPSFSQDRLKVEGLTWVSGHRVDGQGYRRAHLRTLPTKRVKIRFGGGTHVKDAAAQLVDTANTTGKLAIGLFNGTAIYAKPGERPGMGVDRWRTRSDKKAAAYRAKHPYKPSPAPKAPTHNLLDQRKITTGAGLQGELERKSAKAGYRAWDYYAVQNLTGKQEIAAFARHYVQAFPRVAKGNMEFCVNGGRVMPGTEGYWRDALQGL
jgi:hypothetical protein